MSKRPEAKNPLSKKAGAIENILSEPTVEESKPGRQAPSPTNEVRATFIVDKDKLKKLKIYAATKEMQIKDVVDEMLTEYLEKYYE